MREEVFQQFEKILEENSRKSLVLTIYYPYRGIESTVDFYNNLPTERDGHSLLLKTGKGKILYIDFELFAPFVGVFSLSSSKIKLPKFFEPVALSNEDFLKIKSALSFLLEYESEEIIRKASIVSTNPSDVQDILNILKPKFSITSCVCGDSGNYKIERNGKITFLNGNFIGALYEIKTFLEDKYDNKEETIYFSIAQKDIHKITKSIIDSIGYGTYKIVGNRSITIITDGYNIVYMNMDMIKFKIRMIKGENLSLLKKIISFVQTHCDPEARRI